MSERHQWSCRWTIRSCVARSAGAFEPSAESRRRLDDLAVACQLRIALLPRYPHIRVNQQAGMATIHVQYRPRNERRIVAAIRRMAARVPGVRRAEVCPTGDVAEVDLGQEQSHGAASA